METASAPCPRHPTATFTCARCGSFACEACRSSRAPSWCTDCEARIATPSLSVGSVLGESFQFLGRNPIAVAVLCAGLFDVLLGVVFGDQGTGRLILATVLSQFLNGSAMALLMTVLAHCYLRLSIRWLPSGEAR